MRIIGLVCAILTLLGLAAPASAGCTAINKAVRGCYTATSGSANASGRYTASTASGTCRTHVLLICDSTAGLNAFLAANPGYVYNSVHVGLGL